MTVRVSFADYLYVTAVTSGDEAAFFHLDESPNWEKASIHLGGDELEKKIPRVCPKHWP